RKVWFEIVPTAPLELFQKIAGPVRAINFQTVAEDSMRRVRWKRLHQTVADRLEIHVGRGAIHVIEHEPLAADRRPFDLHAGTTGNEEEDFVLTGRMIGKRNQSVFDVGKFLDGVRIKTGAFDACQKSTE